MASKRPRIDEDEIAALRREILELRFNCMQWKMCAVALNKWHDRVTDTFDGLPSVKVPYAVQAKYVTKLPFPDENRALRDLWHEYNRKLTRLDAGKWPQCDFGTYVDDDASAEEKDDESSDESSAESGDESGIKSGDES